MASLCEAGWDIFLGNLREQSAGPVQIVVVVDRLTDAAEREAMQTAHPDVDFVFNEQNIGLTASLNRGLARCTGEFVFRIDDDDASDTRRVQLQIEALERSGADIAVAFGRGVKGAARPASEVETSESWLIRCPDTDQALKAALSRRNVVIHSTIAVRRSAFERLGGYDESFRYAQDYALYLHAIRAGLSFTVIEEPLVTRFYDAGSITVAKRKQQMMFSASARLLHAAQRNEPREFLAVMWRRGWLLAIPNWLRSFRRTVFALLGRGA